MPPFPGPKRSTRNSPEIEFETRKALDDVELRLNDLESKRPLERETIVEISPSPGEDLDVPSDLRVGNDLRVEGNVDAPHLYEGLIKIVPAGTLDTEAQRVVNLAGSLAIAPGGLSADSVRCRVLDVTDPEQRLQPDPTYIKLEDDFIFSGPVTMTDDGKVGVLNWNLYTDTTGTATLDSGEANHPGVIYLTPSTGAGDMASMFANSGAYIFLNGVEEYRQVWIMRDHGGAAGDQDLIFGLMDNVVHNGGTNGIYIYMDNSASGHNDYIARCISASSATDTRMTGSTFSAASWKKFEIRYTRSSVEFYVNGTLEATITTNIPTTDDMQPVASCQYAGTARAFPFLDYFSMTYRVAR